MNSLEQIKKDLEEYENLKEQINKKKQKHREDMLKYLNKRYKEDEAFKEKIKQKRREYYAKNKLKNN